MNTTQGLYKGMIDKVLSFKERNKEEIEKYPILGKSFGKLGEKRDEIDRINLDLSEKVSEIKERRDKNRKEMINAILNLAWVCLSYAIHTKNESLQRAVNVKASDLAKCKIDMVGAKCGDILGAVKEYRLYLTEYCITDEMIADAEMKITAYNKARIEKDIAYANKSAKINRLDELFIESRKILSNHIDNQIGLIAISHPELYEEYSLLRNLVGKDDMKEMV